MKHKLEADVRAIIKHLPYVSDSLLTSLIDAILDEDFRRNGGATYTTEEWEE